MTKDKSNILNENEEENLSFPVKMEAKPELKQENSKKEYTITVVTRTKVMSVDKQGNGVDFPKTDFIDPKVGDKFNAQ